jgi:hypothetical protein
VILRRLRRRWYRGVIPKMGGAFLKLNGRNVRLIDERELRAMLRRYDANPLSWERSSSPEQGCSEEVITERKLPVRFRVVLTIVV